MFQTFSTESFFNIWYWILMVTVWTSLSHRTLGVPYDMILRASRLPEVADRVDLLAAIGAARIAALRERIGMPAAAVAGFSLAVLGVLGFGSGLEFAKAAFLLFFPLALVGAASLRLALDVQRSGLQGRALRRRLARRRIWNQAIGCAAILAAALAALAHPPRGLL